VQRALDPAQAKATSIERVTYDEKQFRWALNEDAMGTEKLAEGIRTFAVDALKLEKLLQAA
jgi:transaldolase